ncbi:hypothetical protein WJX73_003249 [Symbiochloris irregularis]|uniref:BZIP domain-containing protein n=1 Tax=Symbiochloris irregularis TaxID=706552 RepID=A0AAW1NU43_9CHLO
MRSVPDISRTSTHLDMARRNQAFAVSGLEDTFPINALSLAECGLPFTDLDMLALEYSPGIAGPPPHGSGSMEDDSALHGEATDKKRRPGRLGRPCIYRGDPDAKHLTEQQRRQIKRRIGNRESARRMREKKQADEQCLKTQLEAVRGQLKASEEKNTSLQHDAQLASAKLMAAELEVSHLQAENAELKAMRGGNFMCPM